MYTFEGAAKIIQMDVGAQELDVQDMYSRYKDWVLAGNPQWEPAFENLPAGVPGASTPSYAGGNPVDASAGTKIPFYAFLANGWRVRPYDADHTLRVTGGILLVQGGGDPFLNTVTPRTVRINYQQPVQVLAISTTGGASAGSVAAPLVTQYRTARTGVDFYEVLTVLDADTRLPVSGLTSGSFVTSFSRNGVTQPVVSAVTEIGGTGTYVLTVPGGFSPKGVWAISIYATYSQTTWLSVVEVLDQDADSLYAMTAAEFSALQGGSGMETVKFAVQDTNNGNAPVMGAWVQVYNSLGTGLVSIAAATDALGQTTVLLDPGIYVARVFSPGSTSSDTAVTVADTGGVTQQNVVIAIASVAIVQPAAPNLCRLYADFLRMNGLPLVGQRVALENLHDPTADAGLSVLESSIEYTTNAQGHVEFDVVRGARIRVAFVGTSLTRDIVVPEVPVAKLTEVWGVATDNFVIVTG